MSILMLSYLSPPFRIDITFLKNSSAVFKNIVLIPGFVNLN